MKSIVFDTSTIISIATNNLLHILEDMKKRFRGEFYIVDAVKREAIEVPIKGKLYKLEAIMVADLVNRGIIKVYSSKQLVDKANKIAELANTIYKAKGNHLKLVHSGEVESLAISCEVNGTLAIDERTTRLLIENADLLAKILRKKLHTNIFVDRKKLAEFKDMVCNVNVIRSADLLVIAYELGLLDGYLNKSIFATSKRELLDALLWGVKLRGCSISGEEIDKIIELEGLKDKV